MFDASLHGKYSRLPPAEVAAASKMNGNGGTRGGDECLLPVPNNAPCPFSPREAKGTWPYRDASGALLYLTHRFDGPAGKSFAWQSAWQTRNGSIAWRFCAPPVPRPLYGLDRLAAQPEAPVLVVEGEKCADAAQRMFPEAVAVTSPGGAEAAAKADWSALAGRRVLIWPDADAPGEVYAETVASLLAGVASEVKTIEATALARMAPEGGERKSFDPGWDAADAEREWGDKEKLREALSKCVRPCVELGAGASLEAAPVVSLLRGSDVRPEPINWLWYNWLAWGKLHLLGGQPGSGKTTIAIALAAAVTRGGFFPDGSRCPVAGNVVIWSGEDDPRDTLAPRLIAAEADMEKVFFVDGVREGGKSRDFDPAKDIPFLEARIKEIGGAALVIVDPVVSAVATDSHKNSETRRALQPLVSLCAEIGAALLGITHFTKGTAGREPIERINGSIAFGALARIVFVAAKKVKGDAGKAGGPPQRFLARAKSNIGPDGDGFAYELAQSELGDFPGVSASRVVWGAGIEGSARELLADAEAVAPEGEGDALGEAKSFLREILASGPVSHAEIKSAAAAHVIGWRTVERAKRDLGVKAFRVAEEKTEEKGGGSEKEEGRAKKKEGRGKGVWRWQLPDVSADGGEEL